MPDRAGFRRIIIAAAVVFAGCLAGIIAIEGILQLSGVWIGRHSDTLFTVLTHDEVLGWRMKPRATQTVDLVDVEDIPVRSNSIGFRDDELVIEKQTPRCRIALMGDSFTWGLGVREADRFGNVISDSHPEWECLNFGMAAYGTDQSFLLWKGTVSAYRPDVVVLTVYQNDYVDNLYEVRYGRRKPYFELTESGTLELRGVPVPRADFWDDGVFNRVAPPYSTLLPEPLQRRSRVLHWLAKHSDAARLAYTALRSVRARLRDGTAPHPPPALPAAVPPGKAGATTRVEERKAATEIRLLGALVGQMAAEIRSGGAAFLVVLAGDPIPNFDIQKTEWTEAGIPFVDATTDGLAETPPAGEQGIYFPYNGHWTPAAHRRVAGLLADEIRRLGLCARSN